MAIGNQKITKKFTQDIRSAAGGADGGSDSGEGYGAPLGKMPEGNQAAVKDPEGKGISEGGSSTAGKAAARAPYGINGYGPSGNTEDIMPGPAEGIGPDPQDGRSAGSQNPGGKAGGDSSSAAIGRKKAEEEKAEDFRNGTQRSGAAER